MKISSSRWVFERNQFGSCIQACTLDRIKHLVERRWVMSHGNFNRIIHFCLHKRKAFQGLTFTYMQLVGFAFFISSNGRRVLIPIYVCIVNSIYMVRNRFSLSTRSRMVFEWLNLVWPEMPPKAESRIHIINRSFFYKRRKNKILKEKKNISWFLIFSHHQTVNGERWTLNMIMKNGLS